MATESLTRAEPLPDVLGGIDLTDHRSFADGVPYDLFARLREEAPVFFHPHGTSRDDGFWVFTKHADIAAAAADTAFSAQGGGGREGGGTHLEDLPTGMLTGVLLFMMDDPRHELIKRVLTPFVTGRSIAALEPTLRGRTRELLDGAVAAGEVDVVPAVAEPLALHAITSLLGVPPDDRPLIADWVRGTLGFTDRRTGRPTDGSRATFTAMREYFARFLVAKRAEPTGDLGSVIALGRVPGDAPMSDLERDTHASVLFVSGYEQPRNTLAAAVQVFAEHPDQWAALKADRSLLPGAVEEVLRWAPANPYNRRTATRDVVVRGHHIRAGDKVTFWWPAANRDPEVFADPDVFDIRRHPNPHLAFGAGTHVCSGDSFGRMLLRLLLTELLDRVDAVELTGPPVFAPNNKHTVLLDLPVRFVTTANPEKDSVR
ncbi:cytochrome P450 [Actinosynnema sp. NPDC053489]|uniref:cytochrome P450 n=1 Tax=Actinosynnema sp. NPDC053489 TaxID=3363916 RepID=UPI0037C4F65D